MTTVVALGETVRGTAAEQLADLRERIADLADTLAGERVVVTFGIGPQLEAELSRQKQGTPEAPQLPLYVGVARAQAETAELVATELRPVTAKPIVCVQLHVLVDADGEPLELVEGEQIPALLDEGALVVLGPGIPVARRGDALRGVNVLVDAAPLLPQIA